jgi:hypothetical protein
MQKRKSVTIGIFVGALLCVGSAPALADSRSGSDRGKLSVSLVIGHPVRMQVQPDLICLYNYASRTFSLRQTHGARSFDQIGSLPARFQTRDDDQCKNGQALQFDAEPVRGEEYALLHVLIEPD